MSTATTARSGQPPERAPLTLLDARNVTMRFGGLVAVDDVTMEVHEGEIVGLIGPNGAGKTTFFNCLTGMYKPTEGRVSLFGTTIPPKPRAVVKAGMARTFQNIRLFGNMTALENVMVGGHLVTKPTFLRRLLWLPSARRDERDAAVHAARCLQRVGLSDQASTQASSLSYGDQRRLEIARALASDPSLLILDEPAAGMNHVEADALSDLIASLARDGLTILLIEHNVGMVMKTCSRIVVLNFGQVIATGSPDEIINNPAVIEAYLGSSESEDAS